MRFQIRSILRALRVPLAMSGYVGRSVTFHGTINMQIEHESRVHVLSLALSALLVGGGSDGNWTQKGAGPNSYCPLVPRALGFLESKRVVSDVLCSQVLA